MTAILLDRSLATDAPERLHDPHGRAGLRRPRLRATVRRPRLLAALDAPDAPPFAILVAPAGYGKTTLLSEWCRHDPRPFAWVTLDRRHDDPQRLLRSIARAVDDAAALAPDGRLVLVLDDIHAIRSARALEAVAAIAAQPPEGMRIALASRAELPLPVARLRAEGLVSELRAPELAMTRREAGALLKAAGLRLERADLDALVRRTEGWPAALALAALSLSGQTITGPAVARFGGGDRLVAEYLRDEVLTGLSEDERRFALQTSVLEVLSAPLCDAVLERSGSGRTLAGLRSAGFPLVALDRTDEHHRHHRLLADMLRAELHRTEPDAAPVLHLRASGWHARGGDRERALHHALEADAVGRAGELVWAGVPASIEQGSGAAVEHWLSRFTREQVAAHPLLALAAAGTQLAYGQGHLAEHWVRAAAAAVPAAADADAVRGGVAALSAALGRDGLARMTADAARGSALLAPDSPCQALCGLIAGVASHLRGEGGRARGQLEDAARRAAVPAPQIHALCLAQLALLALDEHDSEDAARCVSRARAQVARRGLERYPTSALVLAVSALVRAQRGRVEDAGRDLRAAAALLERLTDLAPWHEVELGIVLARAALRLGDAKESRARLSEAGRLAARLPEAIVLGRWLRTAEDDLAVYTRTVSSLPSALTPAEVRILQFLPTHLSFREIGERTYVSANTVKTQANAVYRKLGVRSRSEAVRSAHALGLLD